MVRHLTWSVCVILGLIACMAFQLAQFPESQAASPPISLNASNQPASGEWKMVWDDEFNGPEIDKNKWDFDRGSGFLAPGTNEWLPGWGNNELEFYTKRPENAEIREGMLHLRALKETYKGCAYTSARITTRDLFSKKYGRFEFRAKLPTGKGIWPGIWLRPQKDKYGPWAASGEIDIVEAKGQEPEKVLGTLHYGSRWPANTHTGKDYILPGKGSIAEFHVYALEWQPGSIRWYVDDHLYQTQNFWWSCSDQDGPKGVVPTNEAELNPWPAPFDQPFYLVMNVAVGGNFLGNPDLSTGFPAEMVVDYVRAYDKVSGYGSPIPRGPGGLPFAKP